MNEQVSKRSLALPDKGFKVFFNASNSGFGFESRGLPTIDVLDCNSKKLGLVLGTLIDWQNETVCSQSVCLLYSEEDYIAQPALLEKELYHYAGSWIAFFFIPTLSRVYLDSNGSLGILFDPDLAIAASGVLEMLELDDYAFRLDDELIDKLDIQHNGWFPSGLSAHKGITRLLPNHYLDLSSWQSVRHWPNESIVESSVADDIAETVDVINKVVKGTISSLLNDGGGVSVALTAGNETRYLLAISELFWDNLTFISVQFPNSDLDVYTAKSLTKQLGLHHQVLSCSKNAKHEVERFPYMVSHGVSGGDSAVYGKSLDPLKKFKYFVGGLGGEVGRAYIHKAGDDDGTKIDAPGILRRLGLPIIPQLLSSTDKWLDEVKHLHSSMIVDLAYIELRMGPWGFGMSYASYPCTPIHPLVNRDVYSHLLSLPLAVRKENFIEHLIREVNPQVLMLPVNKYDDWRDYFTFIKKLTSRKIISKLRKSYA